MNCLSLIRSKFPRFLPRIKAKTLSSICNVPKDNYKYRKCFSFTGGVLRKKTGVRAVPAGAKIASFPGISKESKDSYGRNCEIFQFAESANGNGRFYTRKVSETWRSGNSFFYSTAQIASSSLRLRFAIREWICY